LISQAENIIFIDEVYALQVGQLILADNARRLYRL